MFEFMLLIVAALALGGLVIAYDGSRDAFHPLVLVGPMLAFLYAWMPFQLVQHNSLARFFDAEQLSFVQTLNILGVLGFIVTCLAVGVRVPDRQDLTKLSSRTANRLLLGAAVLGTVGLICWSISIINVGGFTAAFSSSYSGGNDASGYVRDGAMLLLVGVLLCMTSLSAGGPKLSGILLMLTFALPWSASALLMGRRGPTFNLVVILLMGWYINRRKRPPLLAVMGGGLILAWFVLFLVTNRQQIYLGSDFNLKTDVSNQVEKPDTGNEYIYGTGTVLSAERRDHYFWMRRYLAQIMVRPIPSAIWPTKYEDFGVPELLYNAGTGEGFGDTLGWVGAVGSAPGIIADLWLEVWWFAPLLMALVGFGYGMVWKRAVTRGGPWATQYVILAALSIYLIMQTGEAIIFRTLELSIPAWIVWKWALMPPVREGSRRFLPSRRRDIALHAPALEPISDWKGSLNA
jgi:hypothetical protein